jgi:hypothetical protein
MDCRRLLTLNIHYYTSNFKLQTQPSSLLYPPFIFSFPLNLHLISMLILQNSAIAILCSLSLTLSASLSIVLATSTSDPNHNSKPISDSDSPFNPRDYTKRSTKCKAIKRDADPGSEIVDITLTYVDINPSANTTLVMLHGWPSLWSTWSYQIQEFKEYLDLNQVF